MTDDAEVAVSVTDGGPGPTWLFTVRAVTLEQLQKALEFRSSESVKVDFEPFSSQEQERLHLLYSHLSSGESEESQTAVPVLEGVAVVTLSVTDTGASESPIIFRMSPSHKVGYHQDDCTVDSDEDTSGLKHQWVVRSRWFWKKFKLSSYVARDKKHVIWSESCKQAMHQQPCSASACQEWDDKLDNDASLADENGFCIQTIDDYCEVSNFYAQAEGDVAQRDAFADRKKIVLFAVHGIGESVWSTEPKVIPGLKIPPFRRDTREFQARLNAQHEHLHGDSDTIEGAARFLVIPIEWHDALHGQESEIDSIMKQVALTTGSKAGRVFSQQVFIDILLYEKYHMALLPIVAHRVASAAAAVNAVLDEGQTVHKGILGHSLGSVIVYDLLRSVPTAEGEPRSYLTGLSTIVFAGSPLGMFLAIRDQDEAPQGEASAEHTTGAYFAHPPALCEDACVYNVFDECDPVAHRLEPLLGGRATDIRPVLPPEVIAAAPAPSSSTEDLGDAVKKVGGGLLRHGMNFMSSMRSPRTATAEDGDGGDDNGDTHGGEDEEGGDYDGDDDEQNVTAGDDESEVARVIAQNHGNRVDFVLPPSFVPGAIRTLTSHTSYFGSDDFAAFVARQCAL